MSQAGAFSNTKTDIVNVVLRSFCFVTRGNWRATRCKVLLWTGWNRSIRVTQKCAGFQGFRLPFLLPLCVPNRKKQIVYFPRFQGGVPGFAGAAGAGA